MSRKSKRKILFGLKVLAICGAAVFMVNGVSKIYSHAQVGTSEETETYRVIEENTKPEPDAAVSAEVEDKEVSRNQSVEETSEHDSKIASMDWGSEDAYLLAKIAMAEAESEGVEGKALVMLVVLNRVWSDEFPDSIPEVIFQEGQFSPVNNGRFDRVEPDQECYDALELIQVEKWDESQGALYFESKSASDWHSENLQFLFQYGNHYFYK